LAEDHHLPAQVPALVVAVGEAAQAAAVAAAAVEDAAVAAEAAKPISQIATKRIELQTQQGVHMRRIVLMMCIALCVAGSVFGQSSDCTSTVVDEVGVLSGRTKDIETAVKKLTDMGAEVHVHEVKTMGSAPNLEAYVMEKEQSCPAWQVSSHRKGNLILFVHVKQERLAGIYSGLDFKQPMDANYARIIAEHMRPYWRQDDYAGAFIAGIDETHRVVYQHLHPGSLVSNTTFSFAEVGYVVAAVALLACLVLFFKGFFRWRGERQSATSLKKETQLVAQLAKQRATRRLWNNDTLTQAIETDLGKLVQQGVPLDSNVETVYQKLKEAHDKAWLQYAEYGPENVSFQPEDKGLSLGQYALLSKAYQDLNGTLDTVDELKSELEALIKQPEQGKSKEDFQT
jgi:uncharacterized membrane protein YgcG